MTDTGGEMLSPMALRVSDADRNGTMRRLHNAVALGLIDINEFEQRSSRVSYARTRIELDGLVDDLPGPGAIYLSQSLKFRRPVRIGDVVTARVRITAIDADSGRVTLETLCLVGDKTVVEGEAVVLVGRRST